jgi:hypothetical protein
MLYFLPPEAAEGIKTTAALVNILGIITEKTEKNQNMDQSYLNLPAMLFKCL